MQKYIEIENAIVKEFYDENKTVYRFKYMCGDDKEFCEDSDMSSSRYFVTDEGNIYHECNLRKAVVL